VPVSVCLEEEALGLLSPGSRAGAATLACLRENVQEGVCKQQHRMQITRPCPSLVWIRGIASLL
jgi:hypothetical protein